MNRGRFAHLAGGYLFLAPYLSLFVAFLVLPLAFGLWLSLFNWELISSAAPRFIGAGNYREALGSAHFWQAAGATFRFVVLATPLVTAFALGLALLLTHLPDRLQGFLRAAFFLPTLISISVAAILWRWFYNSDFGLFNALLSEWFELRLPWTIEPRWAMKSIVLMTLWWTVGGPMVILLAGLKQIPLQFHEAALIDGATGWQSFVHVTLPQLRPVLLLVFVLNTIASFQVFGQPLLITMGGPEFSTRVLVQYIYEVAFNFYRMGYAAAMSWLLFLLIATLSYLQFRFLKEK